MRNVMRLAVAAMALAVALPVAVSAQGNGRGPGTQGRNEDRDRRDPQGRYENDRRDRDDDDRYERRRDDDGWYNQRRGGDDDWYENRRDRGDRWEQERRGNGQGPAFCRSGAGHPVYGRQWCVQKGFGLGRNVRWDRVRWDDVIFRRPMPRRDYELRRDVLQDVLGSVVFGRLDMRRRQYGINAPLTGYWRVDGGRSVMLVTAGGFPLAELIDHNYDRRVDMVLVNFGR